MPILARDDPSLARLLNLLNMLYGVNKLKRKISYKEFYNEFANSNKDFKHREIRKWYRNRRDGTKFVNIYDYAWMLNAESKYLMLMIETDISQTEELKELRSGQGIMNAIMQGASLSPYCVIEVRRNNLIEDSLNVLSRNNLNFKKELKVKFVGEQGVDAGGVKKEFFQLIMKQLFDPVYSMFTYNEETRTYWFNPDTFEPLIKFELIGFIIGLALYNNIILDVHFPLVLYKKLMGLEPTVDVIYIYF